MIKVKSLKVQKFKNGFTIVELLVAMSLFLTVTGIATAGFIKAIRSQRAISNLIEVDNNASLTLEQMAREVRTGYTFNKISDTELQFASARGQKVGYRLNEEAIERAFKDGVTSEIDNSDYKKITADNVRITNFKITLSGESSGDALQPRVTVNLTVGLSESAAANTGLESVSTNIQTTISSRILDVP